MRHHPKRVYLFMLVLAIFLPACMLFTPRDRVLVLPTPEPQPRDSSPAFHPTPTVLPLPTQVVPLETETPEGDRRDPSLLERQLPNRQVIAETEHFVLFAQDGYLPVDKDWWLEEMEVVYDYVSGRLDGATVTNKISLAFDKPDQRACPVRGLASYDEVPIVIIFADENSSREYLLGVLAHELGHAIPSEGFPGGLPDDQALTEGLATWASGKYWMAWKQVPSFDALVRSYMKDGMFEAPTQNLDMHGIYPWQDGVGQGCLERRDSVYSTWGAFLGYLVETYGWEKAHALFTSPTEARGSEQVIYPPDYEGVYGKSLNQLEFDWLSQLFLEKIGI